jgi:hypothetical protein
MLMKKIMINSVYFEQINTTINQNIIFALPRLVEIFLDYLKQFEVSSMYLVLQLLGFWNSVSFPGF